LCVRVEVVRHPCIPFLITIDGRDGEDMSADVVILLDRGVVDGLREGGRVGADVDYAYCHVTQGMQGGGVTHVSTIDRQLIDL